jgi:urocanate hydratase
MLGISAEAGLGGLLFVSSGLGGMSGAQTKAGDITGCVTVVAEVDMSRIKTRLDQGWVKKCSTDLDEIFAWVEKARADKEALSIAYHGNIVTLLQYANEKNVKIDLLSDQTSCHVPYDGGYCPVTLTFEERTEMLSKDRAGFKKLVDESLALHFEAVKQLAAKGTYFFDYGNAFLKTVYESGIKEVSKNGIDDKEGFIFPSYVEDIMGPELFDYGYGPFRWICLSRNPEDLKKTDAAAMACIDPNKRSQDRDNYVWIRDAEKNRMVVGTQARILYQDAEGRRKIALKFNEMIRNGEVGPIMLGRDHHDVSGTDSPFRETSNIKDGSNMTADMAIQCFAGNAARGMSLTALHSGGGVGVSKSINGGFGLVLDGSQRIDEIIKSAMLWDVMGGVARRAWARNENAVETASIYNEAYSGKSQITLPHVADDALIDKLLA